MVKAHQILARKSGKTRSQFVYSTYLMVKEGILTEEQGQIMVDAFDGKPKDNK